MYDERGYSIAGNVQRARYKLALSRRSRFEALQEAKAIKDAAERDAWLRIARESRQDARYWVRQLREAAKQCAA